MSRVRELLCYSAPPLKQAYVHSLPPLDFPPPGSHGHNDNVYLVLAHGVEPKSPDYKSGALPLSYTSMLREPYSLTHLFRLRPAYP